MNPPPTLQRLLSRAREALSYSFDFSQPHSAAAAPATLDVMGGIAEITGSPTCRMPLDRQAAVLIQPRDDRDVQIFSFNVFDEHRPFTLRMPIDRLRSIEVDPIREELADPNRAWAGDALAMIRLDEDLPGLNVAMLNDIPGGFGIGAAAAMQVAIVLALSNLRSAAPPDVEEIASFAMAADRLLERIGLHSTRLAAAGGATFKVPDGFEISAIVGVKRSKDAAMRLKRHLLAATAAHQKILHQMR